ncbi:MAG TPA: isocitrate/isopropylmalate family dehydrogenase [Polyangiaceae bacterium]|jgi:3-isopropylmalate dehydrogenase|nr:isocitrate/isopropylmalate family dehydrogenase [Polyangiaceae bacterium]
MKKVAIIGGDGIGPEVIGEGVRVLDWFRERRGVALELWHLDLGAERYLRDGSTFPDDIKQAIAGECAAVLLGALGDARVPNFEHAREILFGMRFGFDLYANVRPIRALADSLVPLRGRTAQDVDFVVFRENTEGIYAGIGGQLRRGTADEIAINEDINTRKGVERIVRAAFGYAKRSGRGRVHMADKSNAMRHAHELWLRVFHEVRAEYADIEAQHLYIDALCFELIRDPSQFEVIVTNNLFGDIVTDLGAALQGGLGVAASVSSNADHPERVKLFEPVHGSAPKLVGRGLANPVATLLCVAMLFDELGFREASIELEGAIAGAVRAGETTPDLGGSLGTRGATDSIIARLAPA